MVLAQQFYLTDFYWDVKVFYIVDNVPVDYILDELSDIGCKDLDSARFILDKNSKDKGLTYSNLRDRQSIIIIGETSSPEEFQHTFDHEKIHLAMHIAKCFNIDPYSEDLAYLVGDIGLEMFPIAKRFLCEHCRKEL